MLGDQAILQVVFVSERPVDVNQTAKGVIAVVNFLAIGQGFDQQSACGVALLLSDQFTAVVAEFAFLQ